MKIWPDRPLGVVILAASFALNIVLAVYLFRPAQAPVHAAMPPISPVLNAFGVNPAPAPAPVRRIKLDRPTVAVPAGFAETYLIHNRTLLSVTWPPSLSREWCYALGLTESEAGQCDALLLAAFQRMAAAESARTKLTAKGRKLSLIMEPPPAGAYDAAMSEFEAAVRKWSSSTQLADQFITNFRNERPELILFANRVEVSVRSGLVHFQPVDEAGKKLDLSAGALDLALGHEEGLSDFDEKRFAHIYEALRLPVTK